MASDSRPAATGSSAASYRWSTATKADVKAAVEQLFSVEVASVNVVNTKGKARSFRFRSGTRGSKRKAYVRLAEGHTIDVSAKA